MAPESVQPLRITKSPPKMSSSATARPLSELSPMGVRRNSPSFNQTVGKPMPNNGGDASSPFEPSPVNSSPRLFWKSRDGNSPNRRDSENSPLRNGAASPPRKSSLEKLKNASRVTNNQMFAREQYPEQDSTKISIVNKPLNANRPLSVQLQGNAWLGTGLEGARTDASFASHSELDENNKDQSYDHTLNSAKAASLSRLPTSPQKSSLSSNSRYASATTFNPEEGTWSEGEGNSRANTPKTLRQAKSVTFDKGPPQINEYEMVTPDPSSVASGSREGSYDSEPFDMDDAFERQGSSDREDSFDESLEDADKTPVVLPEDWRFMSPEVAKTGLADTFEDPFDHPTRVSSPSTRYRPTPERETSVARSTSTNSNADRRPLPPLPQSQIGHRNSSSRESLPKSPIVKSSPPRPASVSKAEILGMRSSPIPLEERLRLLSVEQASSSKSSQPQLESMEFSTRVHSSEQPLAQGGSKDGEELSIQQKDKAPPRVSRESILRSLKPQDFEEPQYEDSSPSGLRSLNREEIDYSKLDPDIPIPSRETSSNYGEDEPMEPIKHEDSDDDSLVHRYDLPEFEDQQRSVSPVDDYGVESSIIHYNLPDESEVESEQSEQGVNSPQMTFENTTDSANGELLTPTATATAEYLELNTEGDSSRLSLPELKSVFSDGFDFGLQSFLTLPSQKQVEDEAKKTHQTPPSRQLIIPQEPWSPQPEHGKTGVFDVQETPSQPVDKEEETSQVVQQVFEEEEVITPDSVIHKPIETPESPSKSTVAVPEPFATVKAPGTKLKTRVSATPADLQMMSATRRQVSDAPPKSIKEQDEIHTSQNSLTAGLGLSTDEDKNNAQTSSGVTSSFSAKLDVPLLDNDADFDFGIVEEFDRLLESKKKGYLMRQNTKVVYASNRPTNEESSSGEHAEDADVSVPVTATAHPETSQVTVSAGNSPRKPSRTWTTEPWNGRMRRHSTRRSNIVPEQRLPTGPSPPLPGQQSNVSSSVDAVPEEQLESAFEDVEDSGERGRLFVKVVAVKDLDIPLPENERCHFQMTLDNGLHCVTTAWAELGRTAPIGQEFELVVFEDLEFQLTLQTKLERPKSATSSFHSFTPSLDSKKTSALSRIFTSPKKRREQEKKQRDEQAQIALQRELELETQRANRQPTAWDLQNELVGPDGSFARAYICLSNHEKQAYGRPHTVEIPCWNEWAVEENTTSSTRSKTGGVQRRPPYRIGRIELQLLYVPRPRNSTDEDMPKSMAAAIRQLKEAEAVATRQFEGHLSQQGGDCPYWRRRFFKLNGSKLTAYHDMTRQPRATISLVKAVKLIDDKSTLTQPDPTAAVKSKNRRKSAFAEEEEGYMFVEEGFRIRFANGEIIDFYADNSEDKAKWMRVLSEVVGKQCPEEKPTWTSLVMAKQRSATTVTAKSSNASKAVLNSQVSTTRSAPTSPQKRTNITDVKINKPAPIEKSPVRPMSTQVSSDKLKVPARLAVSPAKPKTSSPVKESTSANKRHSAVLVPSASASPRKQSKEVTTKRQAVRSMIF